MKRFKMLSALALGCLLAGSLCVLTGCGPKEDEPGDPDAAVLNFVATDGTNWDASVTIAQKTYNLSMDLNADKTLELVGTCTGEAQQGGGPGGPGGGFPFSAAAQETGAVTFAEEGEEDEGGSSDFAAYNFTIGGSWSEEAGWGYTLNMDDAKDTVIHVNFDTTSGRHYFYYYAAPTVDGTAAEETLVRMEAKDSSYRKTLDANYKIYEERTCTYMFRGGQEGGSGNLASGYIYLMPDGSVVSLSGTSNSLTYSGKGSWSEDKTNHVITMDVNGTAYTTDAYCDIAGKEGYRMQYKPASSGPGGGSSSMTLYASCDPSQFTWDKYTDKDFEGEDVVVMESADYTLTLTEKGFAKVTGASDGKSYFSGTYTKDANGNYGITTKYGTYTSVTEGSTVSMELHFPVTTGFGPFVQEIETVVNFTAAV